MNANRSALADWPRGWCACRRDSNCLEARKADVATRFQTAGRSPLSCPRSYRESRVQFRAGTAPEGPVSRSSQSHEEEQGRPTTQASFGEHLLCARSGNCVSRPQTRERTTKEKLQQKRKQRTNHPKGSQPCVPAKGLVELGEESAPRVSGCWLSAATRASRPCRASEVNLLPAWTRTRSTRGGAGAVT